MLCLRAGVSAISQEDEQLVLLSEGLAQLESQKGTSMGSPSGPLQGQPMGRHELQRRLGPGLRVGTRQIWLPLGAEDRWQSELLRVLRKLAEIVVDR